MRAADGGLHQDLRSTRRNGLVLRELIATLAVAAAILFVVGEVQKGRERFAYQTSENTYRLAIDELETRIQISQKALEHGQSFDPHQPFDTQHYAADRPAPVNSWQLEIDYLRGIVEQLKTDLIRTVRMRERVERSKILPF